MPEDKQHITNTEEYQRYLEGSMSAKDRHAFEKKMLDDDFESEALDGLSTLKSGEIEEDLLSLRAQVHVQTRRKSSPIIWRAAAVVTIFLAFAFATYYMLSIEGSSDVSQSKTLEAEEANDKPMQSTEDSKTLPEASEKAMEPLPEPEVEVEQAKEPDLPPPDIAQNAPPASEQVYIEVPDEEEIEEEIVILDIESDAGASEALLFEAEEAPPAQLPSIEKDEIMEIPLEIDPAGSATKSIARESVPPTQMDQSHFIARIKDVRTVTGKITSEQDNLPVPGVNVVVKGSGIGTVTDIEGNYSIDVPEDEDVTLVYSYIGLNSEEVPVADQDSIDVSMDEDVNNQLSEVVVTGYGKRRMSKADRQPSTPAGPKGGDAAFEEYVKENLRYPESVKETNVNGTVRLLLTVYPNGEIVNIEVTKSLGEEFDQEAIRLVRESPGWEAATENGNGITSTIKVKIRFRPPE